ncbi:hypothetical protein LGN21_04170 [Burkholderia cepacia]|uniref:hypothetical protein n=1 Tax=Burkholderia cepacia TaxID=292 RepID=UPI001CF415AC|nr:hypothetical protein [Burkholderia cepacia]MCA8278780.1 hypothetical protein [Burkholderia cepacia]
MATHVACFDVTNITDHYAIHDEMHGARPATASCRKANGARRRMKPSRRSSGCRIDAPMLHLHTGSPHGRPQCLPPFDSRRHLKITI